MTTTSLGCSRTCCDDFRVITPQLRFAGTRPESLRFPDRVEPVRRVELGIGVPAVGACRRNKTGYLARLRRRWNRLLTSSARKSGLCSKIHPRPKLALFSSRPRYWRGVGASPRMSQMGHRHRAPSPSAEPSGLYGSNPV